MNIIKVSAISILLFQIMIPAQTKITVQAVRLTDPVIIDGTLEESIWQTAPAISGFLQRDPNEGEPASQKTYVRVAYDDHAIYVAMVAYENSPTL